MLRKILRHAETCHLLNRNHTEAIPPELLQPFTAKIDIPIENTVYVPSVPLRMKLVIHNILKPLPFTLYEIMTEIPPPLTDLIESNNIRRCESKKAHTEIVANEIPQHIITPYLADLFTDHFSKHNHPIDPP